MVRRWMMALALGAALVAGASPGAADPTNPDETGWTQLFNDKGNSGQYFRTQFGPGFPNGYEAQINATHGDKIRSGSLYPAFNRKLTPEERQKVVVLDQLHKPDEWFTQEVVAEGNHIQIFV